MSRGKPPIGYQYPSDWAKENGVSAWSVLHWLKQSTASPSSGILTVPYTKSPVYWIREDLTVDKLIGSLEPKEEQT